MTEKKILEGNKLIAGFHGWIADPQNEGYFNMREWQKLSFSPQMFLYHSSWDWLMSVVEKIEKITPYHRQEGWTYIISIEDTSCIISDGGECVVKEKVSDTKINSTWMAIVEFIKWYNKQN